MTLPSPMAEWLSGRCQDLLEGSFVEVGEGVLRFWIAGQTLCCACSSFAGESERRHPWRSLPSSPPSSMPFCVGPPPPQTYSDGGGGFSQGATQAAQQPPAPVVVKLDDPHLQVGLAEVQVALTLACTGVAVRCQCVRACLAAAWTVVCVSEAQCSAQRRLCLLLPAAQLWALLAWLCPSPLPHVHTPQLCTHTHTPHVCTRLASPVPTHNSLQKPQTP